MFPWLINWSPDYRFPFSGAVKQDIAPEAFFGAIEPQAGSGEIEAEVFKSIASYGKQLGIITEVVLSLADKSSINAADKSHALAQLRELRTQVDQVKSRHKQDQRAGAKRLLASLAKTDPEGLKQLIREYS